jgi:sec-independent protein translocase protein TatA
VRVRTLGGILGMTKEVCIMRFFGGQEFLLILLIVLLLFGAARLPKLARSMREAKDEFQKGQSEKGSSEAAKPAEASTETPPDTA